MNMNFKYPYPTVMVVDDSEIDLYISSRILIKSGFATNVISHDSVQNAIDYLNLNASEGILPEMIFLDIRMPVSDGFEFLERFKTLPEVVKEKCNVVMLSSSIDDMEINRAEANRHVVTFLNKPLDASQLERLSMLVNNNSVNR
jgi:CheY-like chemotaxis protein